MKYNTRYNLKTGVDVVKRFDGEKFARLLRERYGSKAVEKFWQDYYDFTQRRMDDTPSISTIRSWTRGLTNPQSEYFRGIVKILGIHWEEFFTEKRVN